MATTNVEHYREEIDVTPSIEYINEVGREFTNALGMNDVEGRAYMSLLRTGPITASSLAKDLNIDRAKAYRMVEKLSADGFISMSFSSPKKCIPIDPENAYAACLERKEHELKNFKEMGKKIIPRVKGVVCARFGSNTPSFRILHGTEKIYSAIENLLEDDSKLVYMVTTSDDVAKMYHSGIPEKIKKLEENGGKVRLIIDIEDRKMLPFLKRLNATEIRLGALPSSGRMIISENSLVMSNINKMNEDPTKDYALSTNASEMINSIFSLCSLLWKNSKDVDV
ncbi:MAG: transcriptional regulator [Nitrosarchaeum sp.]|nr:transcriptional regulator [Nitrosarchaeum sp.]